MSKILDLIQPLSDWQRIKVREQVLAQWASAGVPVPPERLAELDRLQTAGVSDPE
jgi:hypothetical protein